MLSGFLGPRCRFLSKLLELCHGGDQNPRRDPGWGAFPLYGSANAIPLHPGGVDEVPQAQSPPEEQQAT